MTERQKEATIGVEGTFTKTVADGTGYVNIALATDDNDVTIMYGVLTAGAVKVGADDVGISISETPGGTGHTMMALAGFAAMVASQNCRFPQVGSTGAHNCLSDKPSRESLMLTGTDLLVGALGTMAFATSETFHLIARFRSETGKALVVTVTGGTWV